MGDLALLITRQTDILLANVEVTINALDENQLAGAGSWKWPLGEQVYHLLHSLDQWFINPFDYEEPIQTSRQIRSSDDETDGHLSKPELVAYYTSIRAKIVDFLGTLDDRSLKQFPEGCKFTRLDLILGQYRHLMYHIGLIHGCLRSQTGNSPEYIGLGTPVDPVNGNPQSP